MCSRDCVLRERAAGYSIVSISEMCSCSVRRVREILAEEDPLKELDKLQLECEERGGFVLPVPCGNLPEVYDETLFQRELHGIKYYCCR